ncbi:MAG: hypothetical protein H7333_07925 [Bdellovibrionales bacterium]|nr:hypothetical protein [Oligoflexia bacterium]
MISLLLLLSGLHGTPAIAAFAGPGDLDYFKQFLYKEENSSTDPDFPNIIYRYLMMSDLKFVNSRGENVIANGVIQMFADGHFVFVYHEMKEMVFPGSPPGTPPGLVPAGCKTFEGKWSVPEALLVLPGVGSGVKDYMATQYPPEAVKVTFEKDYLSAGLKDRAATFFYGQSNFGNEAQFCF